MPKVKLVLFRLEMLAQLLLVALRELPELNLQLDLALKIQNANQPAVMERNAELQAP